MQIQNTRELADADREVKILELFVEKITSGDQRQRMIGLRMLRAVNPALAERLAVAVSESEPAQSAVRKVAEQVAEEATAVRTGTPRVYIHIREEKDRSAARKIGDKLQTHGFVVPGIERLVNAGPASSQLRFFKKSEEVGAKEIAQYLHTLGVEVEIIYTAGYEDSRSLRPNHYELWFAPGKPRVSN